MSKGESKWSEEEAGAGALGLAGHGEESGGKISGTHVRMMAGGREVMGVWIREKSIKNDPANENRRSRFGA